jgi:formate dehydrogenase maturation protein FdhE
MSVQPEKLQRCPSCGGEVLSIRFHLAASTVRFATCSMCEMSWWEKDNVPIARAAAIGLLPPR